MLGFALAALGAFAQGAAVPDPLVLGVSPVVLLDNHDPAQPAGCIGLDPTGPCGESLLALYYPPGKGPAALGYSNPPAPVFINLRGGNGNPMYPALFQLFTDFVLPHGYVGVDPNYAEIPPGEDYTYAAKSVGRVVQYLRHHAAWLNIDPDRIVLCGRSFGGYMAYAVGLREDLADPTAAEPMYRHSSRPDRLVVFSGMSDLTCLDPGFAFTYLAQTFFPVSMAPGASVAQKLADSPVHWLAHPEPFGRTETPPMLMGYHLDDASPCGTITDPHDGQFGWPIAAALDAFVVQHDLPELGLRSKLANFNHIGGFVAQLEDALDWADAQFDPMPEQMYQPRPTEPLGAVGSVQTLRAIGSLPHESVHFFVALQSAPIFLPSCPVIEEGLVQPIYLGTAVADRDGRAQLELFVPSVLIGFPLVFHVAELVHCRVTQVLEHAWLQ